MQSQVNAGAVVFAKDVGRLSRFYAELAALTVVHEEPGHVVLQQADVFQLVIVAVPPHIAAQITIAAPPVRREDAAIKLWLSMPSIDEARVRASQLGGELNGPDREWQLQGVRVCDGHDPEGNVFQLRQPVR